MSDKASEYEESLLEKIVEMNSWSIIKYIVLFGVLGIIVLNMFGTVSLSQISGSDLPEAPDVLGQDKASVSVVQKGGESILNVNSGKYNYVTVETDTRKIRVVEQQSIQLDTTQESTTVTAVGVTKEEGIYEVESDTTKHLLYQDTIKFE